jgi:hypothetical protein
MAKLTIVELMNVKQAFGKSFYAMFICLTQENQRVEVGITHNAMSRKGFDELDPASILGCQFITKEYVDDLTGELVNPDDRLEDILDGNGKLLLLNSINCSIATSELYKIEQRELRSATASKLKMELTKAKDTKMLADSLASLQARVAEIVEAEPAEAVVVSMVAEEKELEF